MWTTRLDRQKFARGPLKTELCLAVSVEITVARTNKLNRGLVGKEVLASPSLRRSIEKRRSIWLLSESCADTSLIFLTRKGALSDKRRYVNAEVYEIYTLPVEGRMVLAVLITVRSFTWFQLASIWRIWSRRLGVSPKVTKFEADQRPKTGG